MRKPKATTSITPNVTPIPIPASALPDNPLLPGSGYNDVEDVIDVEDAADVGELAGIVDADVLLVGDEAALEAGSRDQQNHQLSLH